MKSGKTCRFNYGRIGDEDITTMDREEEPDDEEHDKELDREYIAEQIKAGFTS